MLIEGSKTLAADRATVWHALNDADFLRATIPDCKALQATADDAYTATLVSAVGPVKASFDVGFRREVDTPMESYVLIGQGDGGMAGSAQGRIRIALSDIEGGTLLSYSAETRISGKIAQLGSRLIDGAARKFSERFFQNVQRRLGAPAQAGAPAAASAPASSAPSWAAAAESAAPAGAVRGWWLPVACGVGCFVGTALAHLLF